MIIKDTLAQLEQAQSGHVIEVIEKGEQFAPHLYLPDWLLLIGKSIIWKQTVRLS